MVRYDCKMKQSLDEKMSDIECPDVMRGGVLGLETGLTPRHAHRDVPGMDTLPFVDISI